MSQKGENIYKRKDQRWEARYIREHRPDGSIRYGYCYGKTYREAKQKQSQAKLALLTHTEPAVSRCRRKFGLFCDEWLQMRRSQVKESTYVKYSAILENHIKPRLGEYPVPALTSVAVEQFSHELLCREGLAAKTVRDILTVLRAVLRYTVKQYPEPIPMIDIVYPKDTKRQIRVLSREEQTAFAQYLLQDMDPCRFGVLLSLLTGLRVGEICALRWGDISLADRTIRVDTTMQRLKNLGDGHEGKTRVIISEPKSATSVRIIPLTDYASSLCASFCRADPAAFVLTGSAERYMEPRSLQYRFQRYTADCGLKDVHFHTLRHTFATRCVEVDFEIKTLSEILGHSSPKITLERYVHPSMKLKRDNMKKLAAIGF